MATASRKIVLLFAKPKPGLDRVISILDRYACEVVQFFGQRTDPFPTRAYEVPANLTISYISPWLIPDPILRQTKQWAINFHPGPPEYPGIGCTNFALYEGAVEYGVTAHVMERTVDSGRILGVRRFPIDALDTVLTLTERAYAELLLLFEEVIGTILTTDELPICGEVWKRRPFTRRQLEDLCRVDIHMPPEEIQRRIRATTYPGMPGAYIEWMGYMFEYNPKRGKVSAVVGSPVEQGPVADSGVRDRLEKSR
jgi:methionyl-tRNA formyltransferase